MSSYSSRIQRVLEMLDRGIISHAQAAELMLRINKTCVKQVINKPCGEDYEKSTGYVFDVNWVRV